MRYLFFLFSLLCLSPVAVQAGDMPDAGTRINLNTTAQTQLPNDEVVISFRIEKEGGDADLVRSEPKSLLSEMFSFSQGGVGLENW